MIRQCIFIIQEHQRITKTIDANLYVLIPKVFTLCGKASCNACWSSPLLFVNPNCAVHGFINAQYEDIPLGLALRNRHGERDSILSLFLCSPLPSVYRKSVMCQV